MFKAITKWAGRRKRLRRTCYLTDVVKKAISADNAIVMDASSFIDDEHIHEVVVMVSTVTDRAVEADIFQGMVTLRYED